MDHTDIDAVLRCYPRIYFACHRRHVRDDKAKKLLSDHQASILDHLDSVDPTAVNVLAKHMGVTASTMSLNLDRLEHGGYVRRTRDPEDSRRVHVRLTKAGIRIKEKQKVLDPDLIGLMLDQLSNAERHKALEGLELLARAATFIVFVAIPLLDARSSVASLDRTFRTRVVSSVWPGTRARNVGALPASTVFTWSVVAST